MKKLSATILFFVLCVAACFAEPLTLDSCLFLARRNNADILSSQLEIDKAREVKAQVFTRFFPQISAGAFAYHALNPLVQIGINDIQSVDARRILQALYDLVSESTDIPADISIMRHGLLLNGVAVQPIFAGGRIVNANKLANLGVEAAIQQAQVSKRDILENIESTYFLVLGLQDKVATVESTLSLLDSLTKTVNVALNAGLVTKSDALQVELKKNEMRAMQLQLQNAISLASQLLCIQIGIDYPQDGITLSDDLEAYSSLGSLNLPPLAPALSRPEADLLDLQVEAEQLRKKISIGAALPQVMLGGAYYWGNPIKTEYGHNGLLFATAIVPLTQWWETSHKIREHNVAIRQYELQRDNLNKQMWLENQQVYNSMLEAAALLRSDSTALEMAKENYRIASVNYKAGVNTLNDVLQAQALMLQAQNTLTDRRITFLTAQRRHADMCGLGNFDYLYRPEKRH